MQKLEPEQIVEGVVEQVIPEVGAFLDLPGGIKGLLVNADMSWGRLSHPGKVVTVGQRLKVKVLDINDTLGRAAVGLKQLTADPWLAAAERCSVGQRFQAKVVMIDEFVDEDGVPQVAVWAELSDGLQGLLLDISEEPRENAVDDVVSVLIHSIDPELRRLTLLRLEP